jgi:hypothetical protein
LKEDKKGWKYKNIGSTIDSVKGALRENKGYYVNVRPNTEWWKTYTKDVLDPNVLFQEDDAEAKALIDDLKQIVEHKKYK